MSELHVYDFDGTLFRSPPKPSGFSGGWWGEPYSLEPPCVPLKPGGGWWNNSVVAAARKSISDPDVWAILCTGRIDAKFRYRVPELLKQKGLSFDAVYLSPGTGSTAGYKAGLIQKLLGRHKHVTDVHIYEDRLNHLAAFCTLVGKLGKVCHPHPVRLGGNEALCEAEDLEKAHRKIGDVLYAGAFVEKRDRKVVLDWLTSVVGQPPLRNKLAHHMTLAVKPKGDYLDTLPLGEVVTLQIIGWAADAGVQVAVVAPPKGLRVQAAVPHITGWIAEGRQGRESNGILAGGWQRARGPRVTARIGAYRKGQGVFFAL